VVNASENEPAGQVVHTSPERYLPAAQVVDGLEVQFVGLDAPVVGVEVPDGHAVQLVCPVLSPKVFKGQEVQEVEPEFDWKKPTEQNMQTETDAPE